MNRDLNVYMNWLIHNRLKINLDKTKYVMFKQKNKIVRNPQIKINSINIEQVDTIKYLGLIMDNNLSWKDHVNYIYSKVIPMMGALYTIRNYINDQTRMSIYNAYCLSHFRYLIPVWGTCGVGDLNNLQILQNKVLKTLFRYNRMTCTEQLYKELGVSDIGRLLKFEQCKLIHRIINKKQKSNIEIVFRNDIHVHNTRFCDGIHLDNVRTNKGLRNPISQASEVFNKLPVHIKVIKNVCRFVSVLKLHFGV